MTLDSLSKITLRSALYLADILLIAGALFIFATLIPTLTDSEFPRYLDPDSYPRWMHYLAGLVIPAWIYNRIFSKTIHYSAEIESLTNQQLIASLASGAGIISSILVGFEYGITEGVLWLLSFLVPTGVGAAIKSHCTGKLSQKYRLKIAAAAAVALHISGYLAGQMSIVIEGIPIIAFLITAPLGALAGFFQSSEKEQ